MTTLDQTATASDLPSAGLPAPGLPVDGVPAGDRPASGAAAPAAGLCAIAAATDSGVAGGARHGSVPRPRRGDVEDAGGARGEAVGGGDAGGGAVPAGDGESGHTAALVRAGLAERLRTAYGQGRSSAELAAACRRPVAEINELLAEGAGSAAGPGAGSGTGTGTGAGRGADAGGFTRLQSPEPAEVQRTVPVLRVAQEELRILRAKRPSPSRRLRRMHPEVATSGEAEDAEKRGATPSAVPPDAAPAVPAAAGLFGEAVPAMAETPLGILIGGTPNLPDTVGRPEERQPVRVKAELVRVGRGTVLVVLPSWRPAIAVSVPTDHLLQATGLDLGRLADAQLSVLINPGALHDRELDLHGWQSGPAGRPGRRGGRSPR
ncbi:hypothetical protein [Kitasatospora sp. NPDC056181]|uniref:hypothetical protein n=1 Tax=Kitasatospora sp. NPDC056181 TaxID=3345737 RepID=UPI0035DA1324